MLTPAQVSALADAALEVFGTFEARLKAEAAAALKDPATVNRNAVRSALAAASHQSARGIEQVAADTLTKATRTALAADEPLYELARVAGLVAPYAPLAESPTLARILREGITTATSMLNICRTSAEQNVYIGFLDALDSAVVGIVTNAEGPQAAIRQAVKEVAEHTTMVTYTTEAGGRIEQSLYSAVRRSVITGANQTTLRCQEVRLQEVGADYVETTAHSGARPEHAVWQGKVFRYPEEFMQETGYGSGEGLGGYNCSHSFYPYFPGVMEPLDQAVIPNKAENEDAYALAQRQRECERNVRLYAGRANVYRAGGIDDEAARNRALATKWRKEADSVASKSGGIRRRDREVADIYPK